MKSFIEALRNGKGFDYLTDYEKYSELSKDDLRNIAKELIYAIEDNNLLGSEIEDIYDTVEENLTESYYYEFEE